MLADYPFSDDEVIKAPETKPEIKEEPVAPKFPPKQNRPYRDSRPPPPSDASMVMNRLKMMEDVILNQIDMLFNSLDQRIFRIERDFDEYIEFQRRNRNSPRRDVPQRPNHQNPPSHHPI